ncbi:MAG: lipopolysaccharide kinase InaA family protein [Planctomycetota bacterium]|jgi:tRNA A-37 threonylcarbamoyl transferase component Bud32
METTDASTTWETDRSESSVSPPEGQNQVAMKETADKWVERSMGGGKWRIRESWLSVFEGGDCPDWLHLDGDSRASLVKTSNGRQVWRVTLGGRLVYVKISQPTHRWSWWRRLFLGSNSAYESRIADYAAANQVATICPVAAGDIKNVGAHPISILITLGIAKARTLMDFWSELDISNPQTRKIKNQVIEASAELLGRAHQNGFEHLDLHAGNVLIEPADGGWYRAFYVDLHNVRIGRGVGDRNIARNLAQFGQWFRLHGLLTDRVRFFNRYLYWRDVAGQEGSYSRSLNCGRSGLLQLIKQAAEVHARVLYAKRDKRIMRTGRYFAKVELGNGWRGHVFLKCKRKVSGSRASGLSFSKKQWQELLKDPPAWIDVSDQRYLIKDSAAAKICRSQIPLEGAEPLPVICKQAWSRSIFKYIQNSLRRSRSLCNWKLANALLHRRIATARPLAVAERRRFGLLMDSIFIAEYVEYAHDLDTILTVRMREMSDGQQRDLKKKIIESLVSVLKQLNDCDYGHRDLKAPNIIVQWDPQGADDPRVLLIDLDGIKRLRFGKHRARLRMLMRLNISLDHCRRVSTTDRLRFLKRYLDRPGGPAYDWKEMWQTLADMSEGKRKINEKQQQRLIKKYGRF